MVIKAVGDFGCSDVTSAVAVGDLFILLVASIFAVGDMYVSFNASVVAEGDTYGSAVASIVADGDTYGSAVASIVAEGDTYGPAVAISFSVCIGEVALTLLCAKVFVSLETSCRQTRINMRTDILSIAFKSSIANSSCQIFLLNCYELKKFINFLYFFLNNWIQILNCCLFKLELLCVQMLDIQFSSV